MTRGFVCPAESEIRVSPEIDILITDSQSELPWFLEGSLAIVPPSSARGQIHVKTELGKTELADVLESSLAVQESCVALGRSAFLWCGAVFFPAEPKPATEYEELLKKVVANFVDSKPKELGYSTLPDCLAVVGGPVFITDKQKDQHHALRSVTLRSFDCGRLSVAVLLSHFYDSLEQHGRDLKRRGEWVRMLQGAGCRPTEKPIIEETLK